MAFMNLVASVLRGYSSTCAANIQDMFRYLENVDTTDSTLIGDIGDLFHTCTPLTTAADLKSLAHWIKMNLVYLVQFNYPYPADADGEMPGWPAKLTCEVMDEFDPASGGNWQLLATMSKAMEIIAGTSACW
jgi:hypothetical protein